MGACEVPWRRRPLWLGGVRGPVAQSIVIEDNTCEEGSEAAAERQIALLEALNKRREAALLKEKRETKA